MNESTNCHPYTFAGLNKAWIDNFTDMQIVRMVADIFRLKVSDIIGNRRFKNVMTARQITCYLLHNVKKNTLLHTGSVIGVDHATVLHACKKVNADFEYMKLTGKVPERLQPYWNELKILIKHGTTSETH